MTAGANLSEGGAVELSHGIREDLDQFLRQLLQVLLVGFVVVSMLVSGALLWWLGEETHPRLNPRMGPP